VRIDASRGRRRVRTDASRGVAVGVGGHGHASGWESIVVVPRAARGFGALVGGPAGIATNG
jgi:hypothetical protein